MIMKNDPNKVCVLIVDDDADLRSVLWMAIESEPEFEVHAASDGKQAYAMLGKALVLPDLIITDLMMPNVTGWELVEMVKHVNQYKHIPIIVMSGVSQFNVENPILNGCYILRKPMDIKVLFTTIKKALNGPHTRIISHEQQFKQNNVVDIQKDIQYDQSIKGVK